MARAYVTVGPDSALPAAVKAELKTGLDNTYALKGPVGGVGGTPSSVYTVDPTQQVLPTALSMIGYGESTMESVGTNWPVNSLGPLLGWTVLNRGKSGQGAADILTRQGGLRPRITVTGNEIPASGSVVVTAVDPSTGWRINGTGAFAFDGSLAGTPGQLLHNIETDTWSFVRTTTGTATPCPVSTPFLVDQSARRPTWPLLIWTGRNNVSPDQLSVTRDLIDLAIVAGMSTQIRKYLVLGIVNGSAEPSGHPAYARIVAHNAALSERHGKFFYDLRRDFIDRGLTIAALTATAGDTTAISQDRPAPSLMADSLHPNAAGYAVIARLVAEKILSLGWVTALIPPVGPTIVITSDSFNRANTAMGALGTTDAASGGSALAWTSEAQIGIIDNHVGSTSIAGSRHAYVEAGTANHTAYVKVGAALSGGVISRATSGADCYALRGNGLGGLLLEKRVASAVTALVNIPDGTIVSGDEVGLRSEGTTHTPIVNGVTLTAYAATDSTHTGTKAGIRAGGATSFVLDDFRLTTP